MPATSHTFALLHHNSYLESTMRPDKLLVILTLAVLETACSDEGARAPDPIQASVTSCTATGDQDELIGLELYSDPNIQPGEYKVAIEGNGGGSMFFRPVAGKSKWGAVSSQNPTLEGLNEQHDTDGDGLANQEICEEHIVPNGVYDITFRRAADNAVLFQRTVAMLDRHGATDNIPGSGVYQDVDVSFDLSPIPVQMSGWFGASTTYTFISPEGVGLDQFSTVGPTVTSGDTVWFASTYVAQDGGGGTRPWFDKKGEVLNSFNFDYARNAALFKLAVNSVPKSNNEIPLAHVFAAPGTSTTFVVRLRTVLPFHIGDSLDPGILVSPSLTVTVTGDPVAFSVSGNPTVQQPVTLTATSLHGDAFFEYLWDYGDGSSSGWTLGLRQVQHSYTAAGTYTAMLSVRNASGEGPTGSASNAINVGDPPLSASIHGMYVNQNGAVRQNQLCTWRGDATGGNGTYSYTWYKNNVLVGTGHLFEMNTGSTSFTLKLTVQSGSQSVNSTKSISVTTNGQICA